MNAIEKICLVSTMVVGPLSLRGLPWVQEDTNGFMAIGQQVFMTYNLTQQTNAEGERELKPMPLANVLVPGESYHVSALGPLLSLANPNSRSIGVCAQETRGFYDRGKLFYGIGGV